jgi:hypothetical protein
MSWHSIKQMEGSLYESYLVDLLFLYQKQHIPWKTKGGYIIVELDVPPVVDTVEQNVKQILESHRMTITSIETQLAAEIDPNTHKQIGWVHNIYINGMGYLSTEEQSLLTTEIEQATGYDIAKFIISSDSILIYCNNKDGEGITPL